MPSLNHGILEARFIGEFLKHTDRYTPAAEVTFEFSGKSYTPDVVLFPVVTPDWMHDEVRVTDAPVLAVEILSPTQSFNAVVEKLDAYFAHGVKSCWVVQPGLNTITIFDPRGGKQTFAQGEVVDAAVGVSVSMDRLFA